MTPLHGRGTVVTTLMSDVSNGRVDQATWDKLLEAYRLNPGNHTRAARHAMVQRRTARRAWDVGYPERSFGAKPIKQMILEEQALARSKAQLESEEAEHQDDVAAFEAEKDREAVRRHALESRKEEGILVKLARQATVRALAAAITTSEGIKAAMAKMGEQLQELAGGGPITKKEMVDLSNISRRYAATIRELSIAGQTAMEMERLFLGEPTEIVKVESDLDGMTMDDLLKLGGYQDSVLKRAEARGLVVLDGGQSGKPGAKRQA